MLTAAADGTVRVWDAADGRELRRFGSVAIGFDPYPMALSADGRRLATTTGRHLVKVWDVGAGKVVCEARLDRMIDALALTPDGKTLVVVLAGQNVLTTFDAGTGKQSGTVGPAPGRNGGATLAVRLAVSPDGRYAAAWAASRPAGPSPRTWTSSTSRPARCCAAPT